MGKGFDKGKLTVVLVMLSLAVLLLPALNAYASYREFELFDKGYESYLSYEPEKAVQAFRTFLDEFPDSSAADAALFWLGRSFVQLKAYEDAGKCFSEVKRRFPDSPFIRYSEKAAASLPMPDLQGKPDAAADYSKEKSDVAEKEGTPGEVSADADKIASSVSEGGSRQDQGPSADEEKKQPAAGSETVNTSEKVAAKNEEVAQPIRPSGETKAGADEIASSASEVGSRQDQGPSADEAKKQPAGGNEVVTISEKVADKKADKKEEVASAIPPAGKTYAVQVGVFKSKRSAEKVKKKFERSGYDVSIKKTTSRNRTRFNVRVGDFGTKREAREFSIRVKKEMDLHAFPVEAERVSTTVREGPSERARAESKEGSGAPPDLPQDAVKKDLRETARAAKPAGKVVTAVIMDDRKYAAAWVSDFINGFFAALTKSGSQAAPWQGVSPFEAFIFEEVLYNEAKRAGISADLGKVKELTERYKLTREEIEYIERYLCIMSLIDQRKKDIPEERLIESLTVKFKETGNRKQAVLTAKLQEEAKKGKSFEELSERYPGEVTFSLTKVKDMESWLKDSVRGLKGGEITVVWKKGRYMILRSRETGLSSSVSAVNSASEITSEALKEWIDEIKRGRKIEIIYE